MSTRRLFWVVSILTVIVCCLVFARFASLTHSIPDNYKIEKKFRILTYSSFVDQNSAGSFLLEQFKKDCFCKVEVVSVVDSGLLLERLRLATGADSFDLVIGLDQILLDQAKDLQWRQLSGDFVKVDDELRPYLTSSWVPFDWSPLVFLYRKNEGTVTNNILELLVNDNSQRISIADPRTSALGQQFLLWLLSTSGGVSEFNRVIGQLNKEKLEITSSWATSYNSFRQKQTQYVFTYLTSLVFHWEVEQNKNYDALLFSSGHPLQIEYAGIPENAQQVDLAEKMLQLMLSDEGQKIIMNRNFMLPVRRALQSGTAYEQLPKVKILNPEIVRSNISILKSSQDSWSKVF